jgi:phospholipid/cholesterol/gamma-HCH transport system substrate-binding protein
MPLDSGRSPGREVKVGLVVLAAIAVLAVGVVLIGDKNNLFKRKIHYFVRFDSASGLRRGNPVQLNGVDVGKIDRVILPQRPEQEHIQVWISVDRAYGERIRGPQAGKAGASPSSKARIKTLGLLGDKYIEVSSGGAEYPAIPPDGEIPAAEPTNVDALLASGEDVMDNVVEISHSLSAILARMERGEGLLGELTTDTESSRRLKGSLITTAETMQRIAARIENGQGPLPRLLNDRRMAERLASSIDRLESLLAQVQNGPGLAPELINDAATRTKFDETLANLDQASQQLRDFTAGLETSDALLPRLLNDKEYGREVTGKVKRIVDHLDDVSGKLAEGDGTAARLINDPQIYDAINDIIVGVNESRILRWLIRNRQKKGIAKRFKDTMKSMERQGVTPPPLDASPATEKAPPPSAAPPPPAPPPTRGP